ncbi:MAG: RNA polymerase sigma factor RpoH [Pseudomonadota bacterium]
MSTALTINNQNNLLAVGPVGNLDAYISAVQTVPVLEVEEERSLAARFREDNDVEAARSLVIAHLRFVVHIARGYMGYGLPLGDLVQEGNVGLMKAVKRFDPEVGVRLVSFAVHWIRAEIHEFVLRNWRVVKVATTKAQRKLFFNLRKAKKHLGWLSADETKAVAEDLGVSPAEVTEMERRLAARDQSFDPLPGEDDEDGGYSPQTYLPAAEEDPAVALEADDWEAANHASLNAGLDALDERSRDIVQSRWLTENKSTLHQLADRYGVSAERIRQIEAAAIKKLGKLVAAA